jgi:hypothetical protein
MLFLREDLEALKTMTPDEQQEDINIMVKWVEELSQSGNYISGDPLENEVRLAKKDQIISDGPFIETKEALSGYMILQAENLDQAATIAQGCPLIGKNIKSIEVRQILRF